MFHQIMLLSEQELANVAGYRSSENPKLSLMRAAVSIILRDGANGTEVLMMQRAHHEKDPWSGQMAFPGGKIDPEDESAKAAAIREAEEEVGLSLLDADYIGQLDDVYGLKVNQQYSVHVSCFVFKRTGDIQLTPNHEVADLVWLPLANLQNVDNAHDYYHPHDMNVKMPAVMINAERNQILWGLSLRIMSLFFDLIGRDMTVLSVMETQSLEEIEKTNLDLDPDDEFLKTMQKRN